MTTTLHISLAQLRAACAAMGVAVPAELEREDEAVQRAALAAHLHRATDCVTASMDMEIQAEVRDAAGRRPELWPEPEDHTTAVFHLLDRIDPHLDAMTVDLSAPGAVAVPWPLDGEPTVRLEGFALTAVRMLYAIGDALRFRAQPEDHGDGHPADQLIERIHDALRISSATLARREAAAVGVDLDEEL
ncbi:hypothetical protein [Kitasatospora sp. NPDC086791]|uniref:hypothetical protein n=1 Tax=Kitasatospora sp. NPDC086791 TaxID=3155178 RepID=UPI00341DD66A